jgi:hypothetical protein
MTNDSILCPSAHCEDGAILLGIVIADGRVAFASDRIVVDEEFVRIAHQGRSPEMRFRFSAPCVKAACRQWTGERCGVIDAILDHLTPGEPGDPLPACSIRSQCRWYKQSGPRACCVCPLVVTDSRDPADGEASHASQGLI